MGHIKHMPLPPEACFTGAEISVPVGSLLFAGDDPFLAEVFGAAFVAAVFLGGMFLVTQLPRHIIRKKTDFRKRKLSLWKRHQ